MRCNKVTHMNPMMSIVILISLTAQFTVQSSDMLLTRPSAVMCLCSKFPGGVPSEAQRRCFHFTFQVRSPIPALFQPSVTLPLDETDCSHSDYVFSFPFRLPVYESSHVRIVKCRHVHNVVLDKTGLTHHMLSREPEAALTLASLFMHLHTSGLLGGRPWDLFGSIPFASSRALVPGEPFAAIPPQMLKSRPQ